MKPTSKFVYSAQMYYRVLVVEPHLCNSKRNREFHNNAHSIQSEFCYYLFVFRIYNNKSLKIVDFGKAINSNTILLQRNCSQANSIQSRVLYYATPLNVFYVCANTILMTNRLHAVYKSSYDMTVALSNGKHTNRFQSIAVILLNNYNIAHIVYLLSYECMYVCLCELQVKFMYTSYLGVYVV